ncbi:hypothetical protein BV898_08406 [Hypsibius exemplaris]|uniref:Uncharacterized protein n=1 Tax=Hypsibius exemplaris TaxID=2072580 RepID=A0A1W0WQK8_HYPEX|nr:hypothetical protein BV898_08406 [Hypsibius exemplaris]
MNVNELASSANALNRRLQAFSLCEKRVWKNSSRTKCTFLLSSISIPDPRSRKVEYLILDFDAFLGAKIFGLGPNSVNVSLQHGHFLW